MKKSNKTVMRNILRGRIKDKMPELWSKRKLTPGPGQEDMSGDEEADKEEEEVRNQENHVLHRADWHDFHSVYFLISDAKQRICESRLSYFFVLMS